MSASSNIQKLLPGGWGFSIPVKVNLSRAVSLPRFGPGSDVELTPEEKREQQARDRELQQEGLLLVHPTRSEVWRDPISVADEALRTLVESTRFDAEAAASVLE